MGGQSLKEQEGIGKPSAKGKFWELLTTTTKPPGVTLIKTAKKPAQKDRHHKGERDEV